MGKFTLLLLPLRPTATQQRSCERERVSEKSVCKFIWVHATAAAASMRMHKKKVLFSAGRESRFGRESRAKRVETVSDGFRCCCLFPLPKNRSPCEETFWLLLLPLPPATIVDSPRSLHAIFSHSSPLFPSHPQGAALHKRCLSSPVVTSVHSRR